MRLSPVAPEAIAVGMSVGTFRTAASRKIGMVATTKSGHQSGSQDIPSAIAEAWFYWEYGSSRDWPWRPLSAGKHERDVGDCEVETSQPGRNLLLREYDLRAGVPDWTPYVLVQLEEDDGWYGCFRGWYPLLGYKDGREMVRHGERVEGVWIIDETKLFSMAQLEDWLTLQTREGTP